MNDLNSLLLEGIVLSISDIEITTDTVFHTEIVVQSKRRVSVNMPDEVKSIEEYYSFTVLAYGPLASYMKDNLKVGGGVRIVGRLKTRKIGYLDHSSFEFNQVVVIAEHIEIKTKVV